MPRSRIVEVNYHDFTNHLKVAADSGHRIEPSDKARWKQYVREHGVKEASCMSYARARSEKLKLVIIDGDDDWQGYYVYSPEEQFCLKFERVED